MFIQHHMTANPVTIGPETPISEARALLQSHNFRHLPVVDEQLHLMGMVTDRDLRSAYPSSVLTEEDSRQIMEKIAAKPVSAIMSKVSATLNLNSTLDDALLLFDREKVGALPVIDASQQLTGIFSIRDLMTAYKKLYGIGERGSALVVIEDDGQRKPMTRIVQTLEEQDISFTRLLRPNSSADGSKSATIYLRVNTFNLNAVHTALQESGFTVVLPSMSPKK